MPLGEKGYCQGREPSDLALRTQSYLLPHLDFYLRKFCLSWDSE